MTIKRFLFTIFLFLWIGTLFAQSVKEPLSRLRDFMHNLQTFNRLYPQEKVWLHCDNTAYFQGDTIWFAAYVTSAETLRPAELSKVLYVELLNESGEVISTQRLQIENGRCHGQIPLNTELEKKFVTLQKKYLSSFYPINPKTNNYIIPLHSGYYEVRAYTRAMLNWESDIYFSRISPIFDSPKREGDYSKLTMENREKKEIDLAKSYLRPKKKKGNNLNVSFYPEGGNIIFNLPCRVAYKVTDKEGRDLIARCQLMADGKSLTRTKTLHDGMGYFSFFPQEGVKYKLRVETDKYNRIFDLPEAQSQGLMLAVDATETDSVRMAIAATDSLRHKAIGISITCRGKLLHFNVYDGIPKRPIRLPTIAKNRLSPGVNQVTLFDADGQVYAERLFFVHDTAVVGRKLVEYQLDKEEYKPFEKINLMLQSRRGGPMCPPEKDVVADSGRHIGLPLQVASLSVRDSGTEIGTAYSENLQTYLLLTSDLRGYIHRPEYYFEADDSVHRTALDLLMMTQGWRRYAWKQLAGVEKFEKTHIEENGLVLIGQIKQAGRKKRNLIKTPVAYSISDNLKKMQWGRTVTDNNGNFTIDFEPFVGRKRFNISVKHRSSNGVQVLLHRHFSPKPRIFYEKECSIESTPMPLQSTSGQFLFDQSNLLDNITVNKNRKRMLTFSFYNIKEEREKYLDLGEKTDDDLETKDYVIHRRGEPEWPPMYSCRFYKVKDGEEIFIGERVCKYGCSIIDEVDYIIVYDSPYAHLYYDWEKIRFQDTNIKMQLVSSFCYTRTMDIPNQRTTHIDGYSEVIDYYHPQYNREIIPGEVDYRRTLYWNPCVELNEEGKADVAFYNNSTCKYPIISVETLNE